MMKSPVLFSRRSQLAALAIKQGLAAIYQQSQYVEAGGLMSYGASFTEMDRRAATYVDKILNLKEFETSHRVEPNRFRGLYGAAKAAQESGDREKARHYYAKLISLCERADAERPELREAKAFLSEK